MAERSSPRSVWRIVVTLRTCSTPSACRCRSLMSLPNSACSRVAGRTNSASSDSAGLVVPGPPRIDWGARLTSIHRSCSRVRFGPTSGRARCGVCISPGVAITSLTPNGWSTSAATCRWASCSIPVRSACTPANRSRRPMSSGFIHRVVSTRPAGRSIAKRAVDCRVISDRGPCTSTRGKRSTSITVKID